MGHFHFQSVIFLDISDGSIVCGLLKTRVYSDLKIGFAVSEDERMYTALCKTMELLQGNTNIISQYYDGCLFHDLLAFQLANQRSPQQRSGENIGVSSVNSSGATKYMGRNLLDNQILFHRSPKSWETDKQSKQVLKTCGWEVLEAQAGTSIVAKPSAYLGKTIKISKKNGSNNRETEINDVSIREAMLRSTGLCINSSAWTGFPGHCRFTIAQVGNDFNRAQMAYTSSKVWYVMID